MRVHEAGVGKLTLPVPPVWEKLTVPVGLKPVTDAVHTEEAPAAKEDGLQATVVLVEALVTDTEVCPELPRLLMSPG